MADLPPVDERPYGQRWRQRALDDAYVPFSGKVGFWGVVIGVPMVAFILSRLASAPGKEPGMEMIWPFLVAPILIFAALFGYQLLHAPGRMDAEVQGRLAIANEALVEAIRQPPKKKLSVRRTKTSTTIEIEGERSEADFGIAASVFGSDTDLATRPDLLRLPDTSPIETQPARATGVFRLYPAKISDARVIPTPTELAASSPTEQSSAEAPAQPPVSPASQENAE